MQINKMTSVLQLVEAWKDIAVNLDIIKTEVFYRLQDQRFKNDDEREMLEELDYILDEVIDWRFMCKLGII